MLFPDVARVIYKSNPLDNVICQLRFPPILKIDSGVPYEFQDALRERYPLYKEKLEARLETIPGNVPQLPQEFVNQVSQSSMTKNHELISEDNIWHINLTRTFVAISTTKYERWEEFIDRFEFVISVFDSIYRPPFYTRLGLRYIDVINRTKLGLQNVAWNELLKPHFLGLISTPLGSYVKNCECNYEIDLEDDESTVRLSTSFVVENNTNEQCYLVDSDFYSLKRKSPQEVLSKLNYLHTNASRLMRWIIEDRLHLAMEPQELK